MDVKALAVLIEKNTCIKVEGVQKKGSLFQKIKRLWKTKQEKPDKAVETIERRIRTIQNQMVSSEDPYIVSMFKHKLNELEIVLAEIKEKYNE